MLAGGDNFFAAAHADRRVCLVVFFRRTMVFHTVVQYVYIVRFAAFGAGGSFFGGRGAFGGGFVKLAFLFGAVGAEGRVICGRAVLAGAEAFSAAVAGMGFGVGLRRGQAVHVRVGRAAAREIFIRQRFTAPAAFFVIGGVVRVAPFKVRVGTARLLGFYGRAFNGGGYGGFIVAPFFVGVRVPGLRKGRGGDGHGE